MKRFLLILVLLGLAGAIVAAQDAPANARVITMAATLNLRDAPAASGAILAELPGDTPLAVLGRTAAGDWYRVAVSGVAEGWVSSRYVTLAVPLGAIPVEGGVAAAAAPAAAPAAVVTGGDAATGARVRADFWGTLRLRDAARTNSNILAEMKPGTPLTVLGASADGAWLNVVTADGTTGWAAAAYIETNVPVTASVVGGAAPAPAALPVGTAAIFRQGQAMGNGANRFSKVGDSMTVSPYAYAPLASAGVRLGAYSNLAAARDSFAGSFTRSTAAAGPGWTTATVLDPNFAPAGCQPGETPLACEYRAFRPAFALIMLGSNDVAALPVDQYAANLARIAEASIAAGVVPVFSTIPHRVGYNVGPYNDAVRAVAAQYGVPTWDTFGATFNLPNHGLSNDGLHLSPPWGGAEGAAVFDDEHLISGYTMRNLLILQTLDTLMRSLGLR
jgi:uncharacterized protein YgiM (DUF1202 family)